MRRMSSGRSPEVSIMITGLPIAGVLLDLLGQHEAVDTRACGRR